MFTTDEISVIIIIIFSDMFKFILKFLLFACFSILLFAFSVSTLVYKASSYTIVHTLLDEEGTVFIYYNLHEVSVKFK